MKRHHLAPVVAGGHDNADNGRRRPNSADRRLEGQGPAAVIGPARAVFLVLLASVLLPICILAEDAPALIGPTWLLMEAKGMAVKVPADARQPYIIFHGAEKKATGYSGCNEFFGSYELKGEMLTFGPLGMTRRFCEGAAGDTESAFLQALGETRSWKAEKGMLFLLDNSTVLARFRMQ